MKQGEVYWVTLNPTSGTEMQGKGSLGQRPCVILTPNVLNERLSTVIIAPCTTTLKNAPFRVKISSLERPSEVALDQVRAVDKSSTRFGGQMGKLTKDELKNCLRVLRKIFSGDHL